MVMVSVFGIKMSFFIALRFGLLMRTYFGKIQNVDKIIQNDDEINQKIPFLKILNIFIYNVNSQIVILANIQKITNGDKGGENSCKMNLFH